MKLTIKNIGKISNATVEIDGITVIAGENNTGKSTIGKVLYCIFNSFYQIQEQIDQERKMTIANVIERAYHNATKRYTMRFDSEDLAESILQNADTLKGNIDLLKNYTIDIFSQVDDNFKKYKMDKSIDDATDKINDILQISKDEILRTVLLKKMAWEFYGQINNIYNPQKKGKIQLTIRNVDIEVFVYNDEIESISDKLSLNTEAIYIDDPFVLDETPFSRRFLFNNRSILRHREHLQTKLYKTSESSSVKDAISEIIVSKKLEVVFSLLNRICPGEIVQESNDLGYKEITSEELLNVGNISTGLKTFVILKTLLLNGSIENNGTIILDEPEIHLHPEWQLIFAELIVLLQKEFGMHILLNTHSPYFLNAIEVYSAKHQIADKCKYYIAENQGKEAIIKDVTGNIEVIYSKLARPLQELENDRYSDDKT